MTESNTNNKHEHLSILISQDGFSFSKHQPESKYVSTFGHEEFNHIQQDDVLLDLVEKAIDHHQLTSDSYQSVVVYFQTPKYVLCPHDLYKEEQTREIFTLTQSLEELEEIRTLHNPSLNLHVIFTMPTELVTYLKRLFPSGEIYPSVWSHLKYAHDDNSFVHIHVGTKHFDMMVVQNRRLKHLNTFYYQVNNDFLYFILNTLKQLDIESKSIPIYAQGDISRFNQKYLQLKQFAPHLNIIDTSSLKGPMQLTNQLKLKYWTLFNPFCV